MGGGRTIEVGVLEVFRAVTTHGAEHRLVAEGDKESDAPSEGERVENEVLVDANEVGRHGCDNVEAVVFVGERRVWPVVKIELGKFEVQVPTTRLLVAFVNSDVVDGAAGELRVNGAILATLDEGQAEIAVCVAKGVGIKEVSG